MAKAAINRLFDLTNETGGVVVVTNSCGFVAAHNCDMFPVAIAFDGEVKQLDPIKVSK